MPLHLRRRRQIYYARGTVRIGTQSVAVPEFSTGSSSRSGAEDVAAAREAEIRADILDGSAGRARRLTIAEAFESYLNRPGGVSAGDAGRVGELNTMMGHRPIAEAPDAWGAWLAERGAKLAPGTVARWRNIFRAALAHGCGARDMPVPKLPPVRVRQPAGVPYLTTEEANRLLASYNAAAQPVMVTLAYQGMRTAEALRLDWRDVSWRRRTLFIGAGGGVVARTKSRKPRTVPMHRRVRVALYLIWRRRGRPLAGPVFLSTRGAAYQDTTDIGGNPLKSAHATACRRAEITKFRVHDWRHHWAAHMVMRGTDLYTLMRLGGWASLASVQRYAAVSVDHMAAAIARLA